MAGASIADYLGRFAQLGDETAYAERAGYRISRWTYAEITATALQFARELKARGMRKGDRVLLWGPNSGAWVSVFFGCAHQGVIVVPMDDAANADFARRVFDQVQAKLMICSREHAPGDLPVLLLEELRASVARHSPLPLAAENVHPSDALQIVFTSGTTAEPKGVVISHQNVLSNVAPLEEQIRPYLKYERFVHPIRFLNLLPLSHVFGQFLGIYLPSLLRSTVHFQDSFKPAELMKTIRQERISVLVAVPRVLQSLKAKVERNAEDRGRLQDFRHRLKSAEGQHFLRRWWMFRSVHVQMGWKFWAFICGGAALDRETEEFWQRMGFAVIQGYGLTETTSLISVNHPFRVGKGSIGKVLAGREVKLAPDGEILVRGGGVASGYWSGGELRPVASEEGWYHTGDVGEMHADGTLFFKGRKKEVIVTPAGMNVYPEDLEAAVKAQPEVKDCVVVGIDVKGNAEACAVLILRAGQDDAAAAVDRANQNLAEFQRIRRWVVWGDQDFPRTSTQKPRRAEIAATAAKMLGTAASSGGAGNSLSQLIERVTKRGAGDLGDAARTGSDLNLSSLDRVELMSALEDRYQVDLSETRFSGVNTVADIERMLKGGAGERVRYHYPGWVQRWPATWVRFIVHYLLLRPAVFVLGWPRIVGRENLAGVNGPVLVVSNHIGDVDVGFILTALPARIRHKLATAAGGEALEALRTPGPERSLWLRSFDRVEWFLGVSLLNLFPLPRQAGFRDSFRFAGESVDRGCSVLVFPEGRHTTTGQMNPFRIGIGLLAQNLRIPVVPMRIDDLFEVKQAGRRMARPYRIKVKIGRPRTFRPEDDAEWVAEELQKLVENL